ncbi:arylsulfatase [Rhizobium leguminosarum]|jgi:arylsulfatase|uniref:arylsulfatase n=1 Tax=Rhizobium leguminosarum TaxID=384 RepID=UPI0010305FB1|nr:arylsulfatase [Rhizobium leguminosarum]TAV84729.1 arylsulfatase [Rhizobium leguminosarum]TAV86001.1 arylsulfatase [Rhizobium leguminosarum]TAW27763.1 arylsulfatase [Rhizobium leguminosarum]TAX05634.1 arylsulfatase [Rhizobium leguminosarum]TAX25846.1 arylsulfatase [Rhizobium leguminosarum]
MTKKRKPNILILWGDDIGWWNISYNSRGQMGYRTPNIDRVGNEGAAFTDYYAQQSCTAGRAAFITGQSPVRTGLTKVGMPGAAVGLQKEDPTIAELLKPLGYATGQFGKNHLGDKDEFLPTMHGFDEFFGNLYHLNAEEEPELPDYPKAANFPNFKKNFGPRGVLHCRADGKGGQTIENTGPLTKKRMETIDDETTEHALAFIDKAHAEDTPFFVWYNTTAMHFRTHCADKHKGKSNGQGDYNDVMVAHDEHIGEMLNKLDELGIADDTIVMYSTDNGPHYNSWPDAGITPYRSEKNTNWEGGWRVPAFVRWPGTIKPGTVINGVVSHQDWLPTLLAAAGEPDISAKLLKGHKAGDKTFKVHIDGLNMLPYLSGEVTESPRQYFFYFSDDGDVLAIRMGDWKMVLAEQRAKRMECWSEPFVKLRLPKMFNLRRDPFERADENSNTYWDWIFDHAFLLYGMQALVAQQIDDFVKFPPRQKPAAFNLDEVMARLADASGGGNH